MDAEVDDASDDDDEKEEVEVEAGSPEEATVDLDILDA